MALTFAPVDMTPGVQLDVLSGDTIGNTTTETAFGSSYTLPANWLRSGRGVHVMARGTQQSEGTNSITMKCLFGSTSIGTATTGTLTNLAARLWDADWLIEGASTAGWVEAEGFANFNTAASTAQHAEAKNSGAVNLGSTGSQAITISVTHANQDANDTITMRVFCVRIFGAS